MKIAITGGRGFIGSATADAAEAAGHEVFFFDRRDGNDIMGPLDALEGADAVIHLAGMIGTLELFDTVEEAINVNVMGSYRIMQWCLDHKAQYTGILVPSVFPSIYRATKDATRMLATALWHGKGLKVSHVRTFNAFGEGQAYGGGHPRKFMPTFSMAAWAGKPIPVWGDGSAQVDLIHVSQVGRMLVDATRFVNDEVFDAGCGFTISVNDIAEQVLEVTGSEAGVIHEAMRIGEPLPSESCREYQPNVAAAGDGWGLLDWRPQLTHAQVVNTIRWYEQFKGLDEVPAGLR